MLINKLSSQISLRNLSLGNQLLAISSMLFVLFITTLTALSTYNQISNAQAQLTKQDKAIAFSIAISSARALQENNFDYLEDILLKNDHFQSLYSASITDTKSQVLARVYRSRGQEGRLYLDYSVSLVGLISSQPKNQTILLQGSTNYLTIQEPIQLNEHIGNVLLEFDLTDFNHQQMILIFKNSALGLFSIAIFIIILSYITQQSARELTETLQFATRITTEPGTLNTNKYTSAELTLLNEKLNWISNQLHEYKKKRNEALLQATQTNHKTLEHLINTALNAAELLPSPYNQELLPLQTFEVNQKAIKGVRVLVAEDNQANQQFVSHILTQLGLSFKLVENGLEAIHAVQEEQFDIVFMDLYMPTIGGLEASRIIKATQEHKQTLIIGVTADTIAGVEQACAEAGMQGYISKPFQQSDIEKVLTKNKLPFCHIPMKNFDQDLDLIKVTAASISTELPNLIHSFLNGLQSNKLHDAHRMIHTMKSHALLFGEVELGALLQTYENQLSNKKMLNSKSIGEILSNLNIFLKRMEILSK